MEAIVTHRIHRVYVMDRADEKPCGLVTCTDILRIITGAVQQEGGAAAGSSPATQPAAAAADAQPAAAAAAAAVAAKEASSTAEPMAE